MPAEEPATAAPFQSGDRVRHTREGVQIQADSFEELDRRQQARIRARARELLYPYRGESPAENTERTAVTGAMYYLQMSTVKPGSEANDAPAD